MTTVTDSDPIAREHCLRSIVDACPVPMALNDEALRITLLNAEFIRTFGYTREDIPTLADWWPKAYPDPTYRQWVAETWAARLDEARREQQAFRPMELRIRCKNGEEKIVWAYAAPLGDSYAGTHLVILADITEQQAAKQALARSEQHFRTLFDNVPIGVISQAPDTRITSANSAACRILGLSHDEVVGATSFDPRWKTIREDGSQFPVEEYPSIVCLRTGQAVGGIVMGVLNPHTERHAWLRVDSTPLRSKEGEKIEQIYTTFQDITEQKESAEIIWRQANFDALTGLPNRHMFRDRLSQAIMKTQRDQRVLALLFIDLDHFKEINDSLGHHVGDALLIEVARRIGACVRKTDTAARLGGDEFTVVLPQLPPDGRHAESIAQKIITRLTAPFQIQGHILHVTASVGITLYPADGTDGDTLQRNADQAMYAAKDLGRNRISYFTPSLQQAAQRRLHLINDLRTALSKHEFELHFQPIVELATGHIHKAEALLRWRHPDRGMVSPAEFVPLAEETGLISDIGDWVFEESLAWARRWSERFSPDFQISVNVSPIQFHGEGRFSRGQWAARIEEEGLASHAIAIEITEGVLLDADVSVTNRLLDLRDHGIQVAIDDFGTGYSSLAYLKRLDIDYLKIDRTFVRDLSTDPNDRILAEAMIALAHKLDLKVIAEGVETEQQRDLLAAAGCDYVQGYLYSRPLEPRTFEEFLASRGG